MPRLRTRPTNQYLQELIESKGYSNLKDAAEGLGISYRLLLQYADIEGSHRNLEALLSVSTALKVPADDLIRGLLHAR